MKTIQSLQEDLQSIKDNNMNERTKQKEINEALLQNMTGENSHGQTTHSTNKYTEGYHQKRTNGPSEEGREKHTPQILERDYHSISSDNSLSPYRKRQKNDDKLQGEFQNIKSPTYEGEMNIGDKDEEWLLSMSK